MSEKLSFLLDFELKGFSDVAERENITEAVSRLKFTINKEGKIEKIEPAEGGNKLLNEYSVIALENIAQRMVKKGEIIQPAKLKDGTLINFRCQLPIRFKLKKNPKRRKHSGIIGKF